MKKPETQAPGAGKPLSGQVRHDDRGQAVWHWAVDTARNAINSTSQLLRKLDLSDLSLEEEKPVAKGPPPKAPAARVPTPPATLKDSGTAQFDPYGGRARTPATRASSAPGSRPLSAPPPRRGSASPHPSWWRRLLGRD